MDDNDHPKSNHVGEPIAPTHHHHHHRHREEGEGTDYILDGNSSEKATTSSSASPKSPPKTATSRKRLKVRLYIEVTGWKVIFDLLSTTGDDDRTTGESIKQGLLLLDDLAQVKGKRIVHFHFELFLQVVRCFVDLSTHDVV